MNKIIIDDLNINYVQYGSGHDVLFLHGWGQNIEMMEPLRKGMTDNLRITIIDFPGFGESDEPPVPWGVDDFVDFLEKLISALELDNPHLVGHSHGGRVSIAYAAKHNTEKLVLLDSAGIKPKRGINYYVSVYSYKALKQVLKLPILRNYADEIKGNFGSTDYKNASPVMRGSLVKLVNNDLTYLLDQIDASTLLIWGEDDDATPLSDGKLMEAKIPDAGLVSYPGCGHYAYLERLGQVVNVLNYFLDNNEEEAN